ncbi:MAG TPA: hypothetical protein VGF71_12945 [Caulobacteraceae bacterium]|jgi:hypothetical protein
MTERKGGDKVNEHDRRAERLAAALKENLKRRKTQARGRAADDATPDKPERTPDAQGR